MRDGPHFQQERHVSQQVVRIAVDGELLAVDVLVGVGHGVHRPAPFGLQRCGTGLLKSSEIFMRNSSVLAIPMGIGMETCLPE